MSDHNFGFFFQTGTAKASGTVYSIAQNRMDSGVIEDEPKFVVINNGTGVQIIVLSENINSQVCTKQKQIQRIYITNFLLYLLTFSLYLEISW